MSALRRLPALLLLASGCALGVVPLEAPHPTAAATADAGPHTDATGADASAPATIDAGAADGGPSIVTDAGVPVPTRNYLVVGNEFRFTVVDLVDPAHPAVVAESGDGDADDEPLPLYALGADKDGNVFAARHGGVDIYTLTNGQLRVIARAPTDFEQAYDVAAGGGRLHVALGAQGVLIFDIRDPQRPHVVGHIPAEIDIHDLALLDDDHLIAYEGADTAIRVYDVRDPTAPTLADSAITDFVGSRSSGIAARGDFIALDAVYGNEGSGLWFWLKRGAEPLVSLGFHPDVSAPRGGAVALWPVGSGVMGYFADREGGVVIAEARLDRGIARSGHIAGDATDLAIVGDHLYVVGEDAFLSTYAIGGAAPNSPAPTDRLRLGGAVRLTVVEVPIGDADGER